MPPAVPTLLVLGKELRELLRDPHVLLLVLLPLGMYPLLIWGSSQLAVLGGGGTPEGAPQVVVDGPADVQAVIERAGARLVDAAPEAVARREVVAHVRAMEDGEALDLVITLPSGAGQPLQDALRELRLARAGEVLRERGGEEIPPPEIDLVVTGSQRAFLDPYVAIGMGGWASLLLTFACFYPALVAVVPEREQGTLETTLVGTPRWSAILLGKLLAVTSVGLGSVLLHLLAATFCVWQLVLQTTQAAQTGALQAGAASWVPLLWSWPSPALLAALPAATCTALAVAAGMLLAVTPAKSFQVAENSSALAMLAAMALVGPGIVGAHADAAWAPWVPVGGLVQAIARGWTGAIGPVDAVAPVVVHLPLAALLLAATGWLVSRERFRAGRGAA